VDWFAYIDGYCERIEPGLLAEPVNAVTNLAFLMAAALGWMLARDAGRAGDPAIVALCLLVAAIGIGSALFHTFAVTWAMLADVIPISIFIYTYLGFALRRFGGRSWPVTLLAVSGFAAGSYGFAAILPPSPWSGSAGYLPAIAALLAVGFWLRLRGAPAAAALLAGGALLTMSLAFRAADAPLCDALPVGTHFVWHLLNATLLYLLLRTAVRHGAPPARSV